MCESPIMTFMTRLDQRHANDLPLTFSCRCLESSFRDLMHVLQLKQGIPAIVTGPILAIISDLYGRRWV